MADPAQNTSLLFDTALGFIKSWTPDQEQAVESAAALCAEQFPAETALATAA
jgi:hypothetical protein